MARQIKAFEKTELGKQLRYNYLINSILLLVSFVLDIGFQIGITAIKDSNMLLNLSFANNIMGFLMIVSFTFVVMWGVSAIRYDNENSKWYYDEG